MSIVNEDSQIIASNDCQNQLDSLSQLIRLDENKRYLVDFNKIQIDEYSEMTDTELISNEIPFRSNEQKIFKMLNFLDRIKSNQECYDSITKDTIEKLIGLPTFKENEDNIYKYIFISGHNCQNEKYKYSRMLRSCDFIKFEFANKHLNKISYNFFYTGLK